MSERDLAMAHQIRSQDDDTINRIIEAVGTDDVIALEGLIESDPNILRKFSLTSFPETPLHLSALRGHLEITNILLRKKPEFAKEPNLQGFYPLHLASAEGHTEVVKALLKVNEDVCFLKDQLGRIPLHLAVMRERVEVIKELVAGARRRSVEVELDGDRVFHFCVKYNRLEALKVLVDNVGVDEAIKPNLDGNTILHLAVMLKQLESIKYMLSEPKIKESILNSENRAGCRALDLLDTLNMRDLESLQIRCILLGAGATKALSPTSPQRPRPATLLGIAAHSLRKFLNHLVFDWIKETQGSVMIVATVIATMAYQVSISPPGGVWQQNYYDEHSGKGCGQPGIFCRAGTAVLAYAQPDVYNRFLTFNTIAFATSLGVIMLIISGFPLRNKVTSFLFTVAMCATVIFLAATYQLSMNMMNPSNILPSTSRRITIPITWLCLLLVVLLVYATRILIWMVPHVLHRIEKFLGRLPYRL